MGALDKTLFPATRSPESSEEQIPGLGPMSEKVLRRAGILNAGHLREIGSARAFVQVKREYGVASRKLLWALEGALSNRSSEQVQTEERLSLLLEVEQIERGGDEEPARQS